MEPSFGAACWSWVAAAGWLQMARSGWVVGRRHAAGRVAVGRTGRPGRIDCASRLDAVVPG